MINGCTFYFDGTWKSCCDAHDVAFTLGGNVVDMLHANWDLVNCVNQYSTLNAIVIGIGVTVGGWLVFPWAKTKGKSIYEIITGKRFDK